MNAFQYFIATLPHLTCEKITLFSSPEELNININYDDRNENYKWSNKLDSIESQFWLEQVYDYLRNDQFWAGSVNVNYATTTQEVSLTFFAYKELLLPIEAAPYSSYYLTLDNKSKIKNYEAFTNRLEDYEPLQLYRKLQLSLPNKEITHIKNKI